MAVSNRILLALMLFGSTWVASATAQSLGKWQVDHAGARRLWLGLSFDRGQVAKSTALSFRYQGSVRLVEPWPRAFWDDGSLRRASVALPLKGRSSAFRLVCQATKKPLAAKRALMWRMRQARDGGRVISGQGLSLTIPADAAQLLINLRAGGAKLLIASMTLGKGLGVADITQRESLSDLLVMEQSGTIEFAKDQGEFLLARRYEIDFRHQELIIRQQLECVQAPLAAFEMSLDVRLGFSLRSLRGSRRGVIKYKPSVPSAFVGSFVSGCRLQTGSKVLPFDAAVLRLQGPSPSQRFDLSAANFAISNCGRWLFNSSRSVEMLCTSDQFSWSVGRRSTRVLRLRWGKSARGRPASFREAVALKIKRPQRSKAIHRGSDWRQDLRGYLRGRLRTQVDVLHPFDWPGEMRFGDWPWSRSHAGNLEFDTICGLSRWAEAERDPNEMRRALRAARHLVRIDMDREHRGLPFRHGYDHRGQVELGHCWLEGLQGLADQSGDDELAKGAAAFAKALRLILRKRDPAALNLRSFAWSLLNLAVLTARDDEPRDRELISRFLKTLNAQPAAPYPVFERTSDPPKSWLISTWVAAGILGEALYRVGVADRNPAALNRWLEFMSKALERAWKPRDKILASSLIVPLDETRVMASKAACHGEQMLFFAWGLERGADLGGPSEWRQRASEIATAAMEKLRADEKTYCGMELSQLLWLCAR